MAGINTSALFDRAKKHVEQQIRVQQDAKRRHLIAKRLEYVTGGVKAFEAKKPVEAVIFYQQYIKLLEEHKGVPEGSLVPGTFNVEEDLGDLLLLAGVYWDLVKLLDRTESPDKQALFRHYMEKFIAFSKGSTYQPLCAEGLRRYISAEKPVHKAEFKNAYKILGSGKCFIVTSLLDVTADETLPRLERFRDERLSRSRAGRVAIAAYYQAGPWLARGMSRMPDPLRRAAGRALDRVAAHVDSSH
jgi:hypothetical protein